MLCWQPSCAQPENADGSLTCQHCGRGLWLGDRYVGQRVIGQGGFGRTLLAWDMGQAPPLACVVKQSLRSKLPFDQPADESARFQQEAERLKALGHHPQIPALLNFFEQQGEQFLVQAYVAGDTLEQLLGESCFTAAQVRQLLLDILPVLQFVHRHQVIHRDIKPANLIRPMDGTATVLVDFGAAKVYQPPQGLDKTATVIGSAGYGSPEQALGKAVFASDLYSLGVTCIHLLTGLHPFDLYSVAMDRWQWREMTPTPVDGTLARVLDRLLARGLRERYATAEEVLADLNWSLSFGRFLPSPRLGLRPSRAGSSTALGHPKLGGRCQLALAHPQTLVTALALSPNGRAIATGASDRAIRLWDTATGERLHTFVKRLGLWGQGHGDRLVGLAFSPDGQFLYSGSQDGDIRCWDLATYRLVYRLQSPGWQTTAMLLTPSGQHLVSAGGDGKIQLWDLSSRQLLCTLGHHQNRVSSLALCPEEKQLFSGSWDTTIRLWAMPSGRLIKTLTDSPQKITALTYAASRQILISGDSQGQVISWSPQQPTQGLLLSDQGSAITALATPLQRPWLAIGCADGTLTLWDLETRVAIGQLRHRWGLRQVIFDPGGDRLMTSSDDEIVRIWQLQPLS